MEKELKQNKKETLEEASVRAVKSGLFKHETLFIAGAKWQQERMYSEEELCNAFYNGWLYRGENYTFPKAKKEWFEQFKK